MNHRSSDQENYDSLIERLRRLPQVDPPATMRKRIMVSLPPRKHGIWVQLRRFLFQPRTVTFVPVKWAPVLAGLIMIAVIPSLAPVRNPLPPAAEMMPARQATLTFTFEDPNARQVALIGSFNGWRPDGRVRTERQDNRWVFHIDVEPGRYEYAFLVDGDQIVPDPQAIFRRNNGFGTPNSIVYATANGQNHI